MAQQYQFGGYQNRNSTADLEHYRLQIKKLKQINAQQSLGYQKKIESLQKMLKGQGFGNFGQSPQKNEGFGYQPASNVNQQILKRDKQINRLSEQNQRLRKHGYMNPDHNLIAKKRGFFDEVADKDAQIIRLKKTIYQLQSKYDGKYYNDARVRNQYTILQKQNQTLRKQIENSFNTSRLSGPKNQINSQLLEGIKYKKQRDMLEQEVKNISNQYKKLDQEYGNFRNTVGNKVVANTEVELLRKQIQEFRNRNNQLVQYTKHLQAQNQTLKQFNQNQFPQNTQYQLASPQRSNAGSNSQLNDHRMSGPGEQKRRSAGRSHNIFGARNNNNIDNKIYNQTRHQSEIQPFRLQQHQEVNSQIYPQRQQNNYVGNQSIRINGRPIQNQSLNQSRNNIVNVNENKIQNGDGRENLVLTEKKTGFYDRFGLDSLIRDKLK